jgi:thiol-disulfide isomerase/thioredoxin
MNRRRQSESRFCTVGWLVAVALLFGPSAIAQQREVAAPSLKMGDPAPKLQVGKWVQGEPVKELEKGKLYVVEFWATWCGPCRQTIPHLNELSSKYKDVTFIGQDCFEQDESLVAPFVKQMGEKMTYRVATDDKASIAEGAMATNWMKAAGQNGIPTAFIIDKAGAIAWIGHPMAMAKPLEQIVAGTYDVKTAAAAAAKAEKLQAAVMGALQKQDFDGAIKAAEELAKGDPESAGMVNRIKFHIYTQTPKKDYAAANKLAAEMATTLKDPPEVLNEIAWAMVSDASFKNPDLDVALKLAQAAVDGTDNKDSATLDTLAAVYAKKGDNAKAVETQRKAVAAADGDDQKKELQATLAKYEAAAKK